MKKNKKTILIISSILIIILAILLIFIRGNEDSWIKNKKGVWIQHGNPSSIPLEVEEQQEAIRLAEEIYYANNARNTSFLSQCLGVVHLKNSVDYAVDIVNAPRTEEDDKIENQCPDYINGNAEHFIELDKNGEIVRVV